jgi:hypothetical protein
VRIDPLKQKRNTNVGLVLNGGLKVIGEWQGDSWNDVPANAKLYVSRSTDVMPLIHSGTGKVRVWRNEKITGFELFGRRVSNLRGLLNEHSSEELLHELIRFAEWLRSYGANVGSMSGSGWSLWRATLDSALICYGEEPPPDALLHGGRQGEKPGVYENIAIWDLTAAYAHTIGNMLIPTQWRRFKGNAWPECGYIEANISIPSDGVGSDSS